MSEQFKISQLAAAADIPTTTVRYYERIGLLDAEERSHANYRLYSDESLRKVKFIRAAQAIGFTLDDVKALLSYDDGESSTCESVQGLIEVRLADIEERLKDLKHVRRVLKSAMGRCHQQEKADACLVIEGLRSAK